MIQGAAVVVKNTGTNLERTVTSDSNGSFSMSVLPVGNYTVTVKSTGFNEDSIPVVLRVGETTPNERAIVNGVVSERFGFRQPNFFNLDVRLLKGFKFGETNFCTGNAALRDNVNSLNITCPSGFFPNIRAQEPTSAPSTARFGGARQLQLGFRFIF